MFRYAPWHWPESVDIYGVITLICFYLSPGSFYYLRSKYDIDSHHNTTVNDFVHENGMIRREVSIVNDYMLCSQT